MSFSSTSPIYAQYRIEGWGNPAGEIYRLDTGHFLALCNSHSTGYSRKVFKKPSSAHAWIARKLNLEFPTNKLVFDIVI